MGPPRLAAVLFVVADSQAVVGRDGREGSDGVVDARLQAPRRHGVARLRGPVPGWWAVLGPVVVVVHVCGEGLWHLAMAFMAYQDG